MERYSYSKEEIEKIVSLLDKLTVTGLHNFSIVLEVINIINNCKESKSNS